MSKTTQVVAIASALILLSTGYMMQDAKAETFHMYVEKMPRHWQKQFGGVMDEAVQFWEKKLPGFTFEQVQYVDDADFVVEWASQYDEGKLGYYSTNVDNAYGKPVMAITLGYFKDKEWHLVSHDYVLQITKHELGHAIGLSHSNDPEDIMYPTIENYESWMQSSNDNLKSTKTEQDLQASNHNIDWMAKSEKYQQMASEKISPLETRLNDAQTLLNSLSYERKASVDSIDNAWTAYWWAKKYLSSSESSQTDGGAYLLQSDYQNSYLKFKSAYDYAKKVEQKLTQIDKFVEKAKELSFYEQ